MTGIDDLGAAVQKIAADPRNMIIRAALSEPAREKVAANPKMTVRRCKNGIEPDFIEVPRSWIMVDIDDFQLRGCDDLVDDPEGAVAYAISEVLPQCFQDVRCFWQLSASAGFHPGILKVHLFYWLTAPLIDYDLKRALQQHAPRITDLSVYQGVQPHYIAAPIIDGAPDPIPRRFGWVESLEDAVELPTGPPRQVVQSAWVSYGGSGASGISGGPLAWLGDGDGLDGFHQPLRTAALQYARQILNGTSRDDAAFILTCKRAVDAAPRRPNREVADYRDGDYLARSIAGAFEWLRGRDQDDIAKQNGRKAVARTVFELIRQQAGQDVIDAAAYAEGTRVGLSRDEARRVAQWVVREAR